MLNYDKYKEEIDKIFKEGKSLCEVNQTFIKAHCWGCSSDKEMRTNCQIKTLEWLCEKYEEPILSDEGIEFLKEHIKQSGAIAVYIKITKKVANYYEYRLEIHLETGLISIPFVEKSNLYEMFKNVEIGQDYLPEELGL